MRKQRKLSTETKAKIAASKIGKKFSAETKAKISASMKAYWAKIPYEAE